MEGTDEAKAVARWATAEDTLYSSMMADPPTYERVVGLVGVLVDHLRAAVHDRPALVAASARQEALVAEVSPESVVSWIPAAMALDAACAVRNRELRAAAGQRKRATALADARHRGDTWVRLADDMPGMFGATAPVTLVHLASGAAIVCRTEMDPETGGALFIVEAALVDLDTGAVTGELSSVGPAHHATALAERDAHVNKLQGLLERLDSENHLV